MEKIVGKLLIVEDEFVIAQDLRQIITNLGFAVMGMAKSADEALAKIKAERPDLILMDINIIGDINGIELAKLIEKQYKIPYIYVTSYADTATLKKLNETKPLGYILKPFDQRDIRVALEIGFTKLAPVEKMTSNSNNLVDETSGDHGIIGKSIPFKNALKKVKQVANTNVTVLIHGETGTGKELFMQEIHRLSNRKKEKLIKVNCAALPNELIESVLFGHEKGSFTGADEKRIGKFELADGGTIFLDEIGELPLASQSKLLRCLQEKEIETIGSAVSKKIDVRIIAATNKNLAQEVEKGTFRADLFFRLNIFPIHVPPLRSRGDDIILLTEYFLKGMSKRMNKEVLKISKATINDFKRYHWPGNVRELQHYIERGVILTENQELSIVLEDFGERTDTTAQSKFEFKSLEQAERERIIKTLQFCNGKIRGVGGAAEILEIHPNTLDFRIKKLGIKKSNLYEID